MTATLNIALDHARRGLPVFPLHTAISLTAGGYCCSCGRLTCTDAAKHPLSRLAPSGCKSATTKEDVIRNWWDVAPQANVGIATGTVIVLDVDPRHGGDASLAEIEKQNSVLPVTWHALTGGGGEHIFFHRPTIQKSAIARDCLAPASIFAVWADTLSRLQAFMYLVGATLGQLITILTTYL
jgi:hypothetical protein